MPWFRTKLLPGSKILHKQKRWLTFWLFGTREWARTHLDLRTPINKKKHEVVELERKLIKLRAEIMWLQKEYDATVKHMETVVKKYDSDSGAVTHWKYEKLPWYKFSLFQWAIPFVEEPPAYDPRDRVVGRGHKQERKLDKATEIAVNGHKKDAEAFREEMLQGMDSKDGKVTRVATFTPGDGERGLSRRKGEDEQAFERRKEEARGKLDGMDQ